MLGSERNGQELNDENRLGSTSTEQGASTLQRSTGLESCSVKNKKGGTPQGAANVRRARLERVLTVSAHRWGVWIHLRAEVTEHHERLGFAQVLECHSSFRTRFGAEVFVLRQFVEPD